MVTASTEFVTCRKWTPEDVIDREIKTGDYVSYSLSTGGIRHGIISNVDSYSRTIKLRVFRTNWKNEVRQYTLSIKRPNRITIIFKAEDQQFNAVLGIQNEA